MGKVVASFESVDMATLAIKSVTSRVKGIEAVKITYRNNVLKQENNILSSFFIDSPSVSGIYTNEVNTYPVNLNAVREKNQQLAHRSQTDILVELRTKGNDLSTIKGNLRNYGALNVRFIP